MRTQASFLNPLSDEDPRRISSAMHRRSSLRSSWVQLDEGALLVVADAVESDMQMALIVNFNFQFSKNGVFEDFFFYAVFGQNALFQK
jgi:hypothetical protein